MDRRQRKTREAIYGAFVQLLSKKSFDKITVGEIIELADVGRATFYAHFETKDYLLKGLLAELFDHIFETEDGEKGMHRHIFDCEAPNSVYLHLFQHLQKNDNNVGKLLVCENTDLVMQYFKNSVRKLVEKHLGDFELKKPQAVPETFWVNYITETLVETARWWMGQGMKESPEEITEYFLAVV